MIALPSPERTRFAASDYAAAYLAAVERALRFEARTRELARQHDERQRRLRELRGPAAWRSQQIDDAVLDSR